MSDEPRDPQAGFADKGGFFRVGTNRSVPALGDGPPWTHAEANTALIDFFRALAGDRRVDPYDDAKTFAVENGLVLLVGPAEEAAIESTFGRMPAEMADEWRRLLSGGEAVEAFGPVTDVEIAEEERVEAALVDARKRRTIGAVLGAVILVVVGVALFFVLRDIDEPLENPGLVFDEVTGEIAIDGSGGVPVVEPALVAQVDEVIAVRTGEGPPADRIDTVVDETILPIPRGALLATLFRSRGSGQVVITGPDDWASTICVELSVVSPEFRPFDVAHVGACGADAESRPAVIGCESSTTVMAGLDIPEGVVQLDEGGESVADAVKVAVIGNSPEYETVDVVGTIAVPADLTGVRIPDFGGAPGDEVEFTFAAQGVIARCVMT